MLKLLKFAGVSGAGVCLDWAIYVALCSGGMPAGWANLISASAGVTFVFVVSARHIFESSDHDEGGRESARLHGLFAIYAIYQVVAVSAASYAVHLTTDWLGSYVFGKAALLPVTFACNYAFMSWLFSRRSPGARGASAPVPSPAADPPAAES